MIWGYRVRALISQAASALPFTSIARRVQHSQRCCRLPFGLVLTPKCFLRDLSIHAGGSLRKLHVLFRLTSTMVAGNRCHDYYGDTRGDRLCDTRSFLLHPEPDVINVEAPAIAAPSLPKLALEYCMPLPTLQHE